MDIMAIIMSNPALQAALMGTGIKVAVDQIKKLFVKVDSEGLPEGYKMPIQLLVIICTGIASLGDLALKGQLSAYDTNLIVNFLSVSLPAFLAAFAVHKGGRIVLEKTVGRETLLKK